MIIIYFYTVHVYVYREFILSHPDNIDTIVRRLITNELGQTNRSPANMQLLTMTFYEKPDKAANVSLM